MDDRYVRSWLSPPIVFTVLLVVFWFTWHAILGGVLHALLILAEILELAIDHLLENVLHVEGHSAQMYTAWIGTISLVALVVYGCKRARKAFFLHFQTWDNFLIRFEAWGKSHWLTWSVPLMVLMALVVIF